MHVFILDRKKGKNYRRLVGFGAGIIHNTLEVMQDLEVEPNSCILFSIHAFRKRILGRKYGVCVFSTKIGKVV